MSAARPLRIAFVSALVLGLACAAAQPARPAKRGPAAKPGLPPASGEQLEAAEMAYVGPYDCEFDEKIAVDKNGKFDGYLDVRHRKSTWTMRPVLSHTGALRLEDVRGRMLMLQIGNKSMLMDTKIGQRLVDNCIHDKHRQAMAEHKAAGGGGESIGIDPVKAAAAAAATAAAESAAIAASAAASAP